MSIGRRHTCAPRRVHFITDADCGYTLEQIRTAPGSSILCAELHQRPTDERRQRTLPAIAIMRSADELPAVGRSFSPEILSDAIRGTAVLHTGCVEIVWEDPPALDRGGLRENLAAVMAEAAAHVGQVRSPGGEEVPGGDDATDDEIAGVPPQWVEDLAAARRVLVEIAAGRAGDD